jgi:hypothetical protein
MKINVQRPSVKDAYGGGGVATLHTRVYKGKTLVLSPRNLERYAVISAATVLKSLTFLARMSRMTSRRPLLYASCSSWESFGAAPSCTRIISSKKG